MGKYSIIIAIEKYRDKGIHKLSFIEADGKEFKSVLLQLGHSETNTVYLLNDDATKTNIESELRNTLMRLNDKDEFILFFSGHGFSKNDHNYITTYDSKIGDLENTSISLQYIFNLIKKCKSKKNVLFLDSCHSGLPIDETMKDITSSMTDQEMIDFFNESKYTIGFASCKSDELSYTSPVLSHSIWTYHLIQALNGNEPKVISKGKFILASELQNYLSVEVPKSVIKYRTTGIQNPLMFGNLNRDFIVADLTKIKETKEKTIVNKSIDIDRILFLCEELGDIKKLFGYKIGYHKVPKEINSYTKEFVHDIAKNNVKRLIDDLLERIKNNFSYKRKELKFGADNIVTPDFEILVTIEQSSENPAEYISIIELSEISSKNIMYSPELNNLFINYFDSIELKFKNRIDLETLIDTFEENDIPGIDIDYPSDISFVKINIDGLKEEIVITHNSFKVVNDKKTKPLYLLNSFISIRKKLISYKQLKMLA